MIPRDHRAALRVEGRELMRRYPTLAPEWTEDGERTCLCVRASDPDGFDVRLVAVNGSIQLEAGTFHTHFDDDDPDQNTRKALSLMLGLLTPSMRLRERRVNGALRSCSIEAATGPGWVVRDTFGLLFWNPFGRRSERVFQNHHLPVPPDDDLTTA
jgi:hypothetical protein